MIAGMIACNSTSMPNLLSGGGHERKARALEVDMSLSEPQLSDCTEY
jgi:hypothetical protein